ncbi:MAG: hypothetical protein ACK43K_10325, partial [Chitinophagales bacterium]
NYQFYKSIDLYNRKGIGHIEDISDLCSPFYAIKETKDIIFTYEFHEDYTYTPKHYKVFKNYLLSTTISKELEFENLYLRKIELIKSDLYIIYTYEINDNSEFIDYIDFKYKNGQDIRYYNCKEKLLGLKNYEVNINEQNITVYFPNFKTECE